MLFRSYWIYDVPGGEDRGGHAYLKNQEFIIALSGAFDVVVDDGKNKKTFSLNRSYFGPKVICQALAVASEPRIFWDGNIDEAKEIISNIAIPEELGTLEPAGSHLNGPSAKILDEHILATLGFQRKDAWLCDLLPETRLNPCQVKVISERYNPLMEKFGLNKVTIPERPTVFCDEKRCKEILSELKESKANLLVLLGDIPIAQFLNRVADVPYTTLQEYKDLYGYGTVTETMIDGQAIKVLPLAHPRQIGALGAHSAKWKTFHQKWEESLDK